MFGDFFQNFGLNFPMQGADPQGGLFGDDAPVVGQPPLGGPAAPGGAGTGRTGPNTVAPTGPALPGSIEAPLVSQNAAGAGSPAPAPSPTPSPFASPLAPGQSPPAQPQPPQGDSAPAAGINSQFRNLSL